MLSALVAAARFVSQKESPGGALFWYKCVGLMNEFVNNDDDAMREVPCPNHHQAKRTSYCELRRALGGWRGFQQRTYQLSSKLRLL